jgi:bifunctional non-homologous end joining protein LigD
MDENGWVYEVKWDGYRAISFLNRGDVDIRSRNNKSFNEKFYPVYNELKKWKVNAVVDGEIIVVNERGVSDFSDLQNWRSEADGQLAYYLFDILWLDGEDLTEKTLLERHSILQSEIPESQVIKISELFDTDGKKFFETADAMGLEGIIAKKADSRYTPGQRSTEWLKIKTEIRQEAVIGGYTRNEGSGKKISALLLGIFSGKEFRFIGSVGTGFTRKTEDELISLLKPDIIKSCPFNKIPEYNKPSRFRPNPPKAEVTWVKPRVVAEISYREMTKDGALRHPSFKGIREDKAAKDVVLEKPKAVKKFSEKKSIVKPISKGERGTFLNPADETQVREIGGHSLKFTNLSKVFWPKEGYTKRDMLNYYYQVAPVILPYMKDRPQTLYRHPNGINGKAFYQKDVTGKAPGWIQTHKYFSEADDREKNFLVCTNEASLMYIASLGCIEMNPWSSRTQKPGHPDWCIIDLDPDKNTFEQVIRVAQTAHEILESIGVKSYCKTSGSTGMHIYIPLRAKYDYEQSKEFARVIARLISNEHPKFTTIERITSNRGGKMYIDFLQNRPQATVAGPYSLRPKPGATVSMPLHWEEVRKGLKMTDFTIENAVARIRSEGDLFKGLLDETTDIKGALKKAERIFG